MKLILLADHWVGLKIVDYLVNNFRDDLGLICVTSDNEILQLAERSGIKTCILGRNGEGVEHIPSTDFDVGVLAWWPWLIGEDIIRLPRRGFYNTHPSLLPFARGKNPNFWSIVEEVPYGVSIHKATSKIDAGDILAQHKIPYGWTDTGGSIYKKALDVTVELFVSVYPLLRSGEYELRPQLPGCGSFHQATELEEASEIHLDKMYMARELLNLLRARTFPGHPGCWFEESGVRYEISVTIRSLNDE